MEYRYHHSSEKERGDEIRQFQEKLNVINTTYHGGWQRITPDGIYGRRTRDAVKAYQIWQGFAPATGNLDENLQRHITNMYNCTQNKTPFKPAYQYTIKSPTAVGPSYNYYDRSLGTGQKLYASKPVQASSFSTTYDVPTFEAFKAWAMDAWNTIAQDLVSLFQGILKTPLRKIPAYLVTKLPVIGVKIQNFSRQACEFFGKWIDAGKARAAKIIEEIKIKAGKYVKSVAKNPKAVEGLAKESKIKKFAKGNAIGIFLAAIPMVYDLFMLIICDDSEKEARKKEFWKSFRGFLGSILLMIAIEAAAAGIAALIALLGVSASAALIAAIITILVVIVDIIIMAARDDHKGIGDAIDYALCTIWDSFISTTKSIGNFLGDSIYDFFHPDVPKAYTAEDLELMGLSE